MKHSGSTVFNEAQGLAFVQANDLRSIVPAHHTQDPVELTSAFTDKLLYSTRHKQFAVELHSKYGEIFPYWSTARNNMFGFLPGIEHNLVPFAPSMKAALALIDGAKDVLIGSTTTERFKTVEIVCKDNFNEVF